MADQLAGYLVEMKAEQKVLTLAASWVAATGRKSAAGMEKPSAALWAAWKAE